MRVVSAATSFPWSITPPRLPTIDYRLSTTDYRLLTTDYRLPTTDYRLPTTDYRLPTHCSRLSHASHALKSNGRPRKSRTSSAAGFEPPGARTVSRYLRETSLSSRFD